MSFRGIVKKDGQVVAEFSDTVYVACTNPVTKKNLDGGYIDYNRLNAAQLQQKIDFYTVLKKNDKKKQPIVTLAKAALKALTKTMNVLEKGTLKLDRIPEAKTPEECGETRKVVWHGYNANVETVIAAEKKKRHEARQQQKFYAAQKFYVQSIAQMPRLQ
jgi:hypothetical protein